MSVVWRDPLKEKIWLNISDWCLEESSRQYFVWLTTTYFPCLEGCVWKKTTFEYVLVKSDHKDFWPCLEGCVWKSTLNRLNYMVFSYYRTTASYSWINEFSHHTELMLTK